MLMDHTIYQMTGIGDLKFFMSAVDTSTLLGPPSATEKDEDEDFFLLYKSVGLYLLFEKKNNYNLSSMILYPESEAVFLSYDLFKLPVKKLTELIVSVNHNVFVVSPTKEFPLILSSPSLGMIFYFDTENMLQEVLFTAPEKEYNPSSNLPISHTS
jgi:hypothetical protein